MFVVIPIIIIQGLHEGLDIWKMCNEERSANFRIVIKEELSVLTLPKILF